jgi:hypothetical protein
MSREEDAIRATTRAIAASVRDVPPLRLEPRPGELWSPGRGSRRGRAGRSGHRVRLWLTPVAAAAVVVAVAVALVLVRGSQNGSVVPPPPPTATAPGGVPRYYVALDPVMGTPNSANGLLVGDTVTGDVLDVITPPAHMSYQSVTAAADDRTFLAFATETGGSWMAGQWYRLVLAPGAAHVITVTSTAIAQQSGVVASALSGSGTELAVAEHGPATGQQRVIVFSLATGRALRTWSTQDAPAMWTGGTAQQNLLTWIDGDRAIAFSAHDQAAGTESVRRLNLGGLPADGDLIADSQLIWSTRPGAPATECGFGTPVVSADGQTIACDTSGVRSLSAGHVQWTITWRVYRASAQAPAAGKYTIAYQVTRQEPGNSSAGMADTLWVGPSGSALVGEWAISPAPQPTASQATSGSGTSATLSLPLGAFGGAVHVGVISHGAFTPLPVSPGILSLPRQAIAW